MKTALLVALGLSLLANAYLGFLLGNESSKIEAGVRAELIAEMGLGDLAYLLGKSGATQTQLLDWAGSQPPRPGADRIPPELVDNRLVWFPLEIAFGTSGKIDRISVAGKAY